MLGGSRLKAMAANAVMPLISMPAWRGALPTLVAAASPDVAGSAYIGPQGFLDMRGDPGPATVARQAADRETAAALVEACALLTGVHMPTA